MNPPYKITSLIKAKIASISEKIGEGRTTVYKYFDIQNPVNN
jgi:hypothetical protein